MNANNLNISKIETYLNSILDNVVSNNTFFGYMPDASIVKSSDWQDMVMVEIPNGVRDMDAYGQGTVLVWLYARPLESGRKNVAKMSVLEDRLNDVIANNKDKNYQISRRMTFTDYNTDIDWHCNVVEIILKVF
jgi:hypothetical protein